MKILVAFSSLLVLGINAQSADEAKAVGATLFNIQAGQSAKDALANALKNAGQNAKDVLQKIADKLPNAPSSDGGQMHIMPIAAAPPSGSDGQCSDLGHITIPPSVMSIIASKIKLALVLAKVDVAELETYVKANWQTATIADLRQHFIEAFPEEKQAEVTGQLDKMQQKKVDFLNNLVQFLHDITDLVSAAKDILLNEAQTIPQMNETMHATTSKYTCDVLREARKVGFDYLMLQFGDQIKQMQALMQGSSLNIASSANPSLSPPTNSAFTNLLNQAQAVRDALKNGASTGTNTNSATTTKGTGKKNKKNKNKKAKKNAKKNKKAQQ